jgi:hypothetical protein
VVLNGQIEFAEVLFYFYGNINGIKRPFAVILLFSRPDQQLFNESFWTLWSVLKMEDRIGLRIVDAKSIRSVVAAIPHTVDRGGHQEEKRYFIWEQLGLEIALWSEALINVRDAADEPNPEEDA